jgi:hypothetical protein
VKINGDLEETNDEADVDVAENYRSIFMDMRTVTEPSGCAVRAVQI